MIHIHRAATIGETQELHGRREGTWAGPAFPSEAITLSSARGGAS